MILTELPQGAKVLIEDLLNPKGLGRRNKFGNYIFPYCRGARMRILKKEYGILFPIDIPEPYMSKYYESLAKYGIEDDKDEA